MWETNLLASAGSFSEGQEGLYLKLTQKIKGLLGIGSEMVFRFDKIGSKYRVTDLDKYEFVYLNNFNRLILDGTLDLGIKITQQLGDKYSLEYVSDYVTDKEGQYGASYAGTYFLWQLGLSYQFSPAVSANAFYRSYHVPSGVAQFSDAVPEVSNTLGIGFKHAF
jgi:outer membrane receptor protein involved in Fe transport